MNRRVFSIVAFLCFPSWLVSSVAFAQATASPDAAAANTSPSMGSVPRLIKFSGVLSPGAGRDEMGKATSPVSATFALYELQEGGSPLWSESQQVQTDAQGRYTVLLGAASPEGLPLDLSTSGKALWLGVQPQLAGTTEEPRVLLVAVPYALKAVDADTLGGKPASAYVLANLETSAVPVPIALGSASAGPAPQVASRSESRPVAMETASGSASEGTTPPPLPQPPPVTLPPPGPSPMTPCSTVGTDGSQATNSLARFSGNCQIGASPLMTDNGAYAGVVNNAGSNNSQPLLSVQSAPTVTSGYGYGQEVLTTLSPGTPSPTMLLAE